CRRCSCFPVGNRMSYSTFAAFYDEIMDDSYYAMWLDYTKQYLKEEGAAILDLACGTGKLAVEMSKEGYQVTGLDLSEDMLTMAYDYALKNGENIQFIQGD